MRFLWALVFSGVLAGLGASPAVAAEDTLERVRESGTIRLGFREDAAPFSFRDENGQADGYIVDLCRAVVSFAEAELGLETIAVEYVPVTAENRFQAIVDGRIDLLCGASSVTLSRRAIVDFSIPTFIDGASVLFSKDGPDSFEGLDGHRVGVRAGTTTEAALGETLTELGINADIVTVADHADGLAQLQMGDLSAYFADRAILQYLMLDNAMAGDVRLSERYFSQEPYGLAFAYGDNRFRLLIDRTLSQLYRTGAVSPIFSAHFGEAATPSDLLRAIYFSGSIPD